MWKDEPLTNRRDADSKFHFPIPLEIFCTQLPGWEDTLLTHTDTLLHGETPVSSQSWKLGLEGSASPGTLKLQFHNAQMQLRWAVRKMPTSVETGIPGLSGNRNSEHTSTACRALGIPLCSDQGGCSTTSWCMMSSTWYCRGYSCEHFSVVWAWHASVLTQPVKAGEAASHLWRAAANFFLPTDGMVLVNWRSKRRQSGFLQSRGKWSSSCFISMSQAPHLARVDFHPARGRGRSFSTPILKGKFWQFIRSQE